MRRVTSSVALILGGLLALGVTPALASDTAASPDASPAASLPPATPLEGTTWLLTNARLSGAYAPIPAEVTATLVLANGHAGGAGGCNQWFADYTLDGSSLTFGTVGSTLMLCDGPGGTIETFYLADLPAVATWAIDGTTLTLAADDGQPVLAFEAQPAPSLLGTWTVTSYADATGMPVTVDDGSVSVVFETTTVHGSAGCNGFNGAWSLTGETLAIGPLMSTKMACEPASVMARETAVIADLEASTAVRAETNGSLTLLDTTGAARLTLVPGMATPAPSGSPAA